MCDGQPIEMENARTFLKIISDRNNQMVGIIHQYTNIVGILLIGIWTILGKAFFDSLNHLQTTQEQIFFNMVFSPEPFLWLFLASSLTVVILIIWRYHIHYIDDDVAQNYRLILLNEKILYRNLDHIPETATLYNLINNLQKTCPKIMNKIINNSQLATSKKYEIVSLLIEKKLIGTRGQIIFDSVSGTIIFIIMGSQLIFFIHYYFKGEIGSFFQFCILAYYIIVGLTLYLLFYNPNGLLPIQKDPTCTQIDEIVANGQIEYKSIFKLLQDPIIRITILLIIVIVSILIIKFALHFTICL